MRPTTPARTRAILDLVFDERQAQEVRYGEANEKIENGTGPGVRWLGPYTGDSALAIQRELRRDYEDWEDEIGQPTWLHLVREELAEVAEEDDPERLAEELIQVAALCVSWTERLLPDIKPKCSIEGCGREVSSRGWCERHYGRWYRHGDPLAGRIGPGLKQEYAENSAQAPHLDEDECVLWPFDLATDGYGYLTVDGKWRQAHRVVLELRDGPPPSSDAEARHGPCHDRRCVNHVTWGTKSENMLDKHRDGTMTNRPLELVVDCEECGNEDAPHRVDGRRLCLDCVDGDAF